MESASGTDLLKIWSCCFVAEIICYLISQDSKCRFTFAITSNRVCSVVEACNRQLPYASIWQQELKEAMPPLYVGCDKGTRTSLSRHLQLHIFDILPTVSCKLVCAMKFYNPVAATDVTDSHIPTNRDPSALFGMVISAHVLWISLCKTLCKTL
jgi:hypothetical protein